MNYEIPLVLFTTLTQIAVGLSVFAAVWQYACPQSSSPGNSPREGKLAHEGSCPAGSDQMRLAWLLVFILAAAGLVFSLFHLGKPILAPTALKNLGIAWLSREALIFGAFAGLALLCVLLKAPKALTATTAAVGLLGVVAQGMTYAAPAMPAINNGWPLLWFAVSTLVCGAALFMALGYNGATAKLLAAGSALFLLLLIGIPALWLGSESSIVRDTAAQWFASPFYWAAIVCIGAAVFIALRKLDAKLTFALCAAGVLLSRLVFFGATVHAASNLGGVY